MSNQAILKVFWVVLFCLGPSDAVAASNPLEVKWNELAPLITGHRVELTLAEGGQLRGEAITVRENSLLIDVKHSDAKGYPKGSGAVPRESISLIKVQRSQGTWGRKMGSSLGLLAGVTLGSYAAYSAAHSDGAGIAVFLGVASASSLAGYYAGRQLDKRFTMIKVVP